MFLALFPFSEVVYLIAILFAWIYIAFGILGNVQAKNYQTTLSDNKTITLQHHDVKPLGQSSQANRCFQVKYLKSFHQETAIEQPHKKLIYQRINKCIAYPDIIQADYSSFFLQNVPPRAPPLFV